MPQWFRLDHASRLAYLALGISGCHGNSPSLAPQGMRTASPEEVSAWVAATQPKQSTLHRFTWLYQDEQASKGGRGSARIASPDSLRFDFAGSLGIGKGSAMVVGDSAVWVVPDRSVDELVPGIALLWSVLGVARGPSPGSRLNGLDRSGKAAWQYVNGPDTTNYLRVAAQPAMFYAEVRHAGKIVGRTELTLRADGSPAKARLTVPTVPSKLEITFYATVDRPAFPPETWTRPPEP